MINTLIHTQTHIQSYQLCCQQGERITTHIKPWYDTHKCGYNNTHTQTAQPPIGMQQVLHRLALPPCRTQGAPRNKKRVKTSNGHIAVLCIGDTRGNDEDDGTHTDRKVGLQSCLVAAKKHFFGTFLRNSHTDGQKGRLTELLSRS